MGEREATNLIFLPGFSTAEKVTNVSGRGVGMDVVKTNIDKIGGTVDVQSKSGASTTMRMKIPLTLAIIPALIVTNGGERYAIPQISLLVGHDCAVSAIAAIAKRALRITRFRQGTLIQKALAAEGFASYTGSESPMPPETTPADHNLSTTSHQCRKA
jgi:chemotaxis protein histidine kinase CheA